MAINATTIETMKQIKRALDPNGILNPGKMFPAVEGQVTGDGLSTVSDSRPPAPGLRS
jgi:hypothetical protein